MPRDAPRTLRTARHAVLQTAQAMAHAGLVAGSSGNVSQRWVDRVLITASGVPYERMKLAEIIEIDTAGTVHSGRGAPSSEWRMHVAIYRERPDVRAIVHTHSIRATAAALRLDALPLAQDEGRILFGSEIPVLEHHPPGTHKLAEAVAGALRRGRGVLITRHGVVAVGASLDEALNITIEIEKAAHRFGVPH